MKTNELRKRYLDFFQERGHTLYPSDTLVPDDRSLLFTSAGMNQFKANFLGEKTEPKRATSCQKCFRTGDLDRVGKTAYHHTFFEMLGNFSFGDYFKREAIAYAWEFLTKELIMPADNLWISVYSQDEEAYKIWRDEVGVSEDRIVKLGEDSNFWPASAPSMGPNGVCGPCSEIFFDRGKDIGCGSHLCSPDCNCGRFVEIWNLVFTQFNRLGDNQLEPLPQKNIDTGMGLERMACVLQGKISNFEIDILAPVVSFVEKNVKTKGKTGDFKPTIDAIVDHARAALFAIADGVYPSNEERGYVIRKIIRKASFGAHLLGIKKPFMFTLVPLYIRLMGDFYPEISDKKSVIEKIIRIEEEKFLSTLSEGKEQLLSCIGNCKKNNKDTISADILFRLHDTWGFPLELSRAIAVENNMKADEAGFEELFKQQQERSRKVSMFDENIFRKGQKFNQKTEFIGHQQLAVKSNIVKIFHAGQDGNLSQTQVQSLAKAQEGILITDTTPFYAESGGQATDTGKISTREGEFLVEKVFKADQAILHKGRVLKGSVRAGEAVLAVDELRRKAIARAHSATHLLQAALREVLGAHVSQQGSLVEADKFRFDFTHFQALSPGELESVENTVNAYILRADLVSKEVVSFEEAKKRGALAFFKDKYGREVRLVSIADYSKELCGGTHINNTAEVGSFVILSESSISSGIRRIEALVGKKSYDFSRDRRSVSLRIASLLKTSPDNAQAAVEELLTQIKDKNAIINAYQKKLLSYEADGIFDKGKLVGEATLVVSELPGQGYSNLLYVIDIVRKKFDKAFVFVFSRGEKNIFACGTTDYLVNKNIGCKRFIDSYAKELGIRGGGKEHSAQGVISQLPEDFSQRIEQSFRDFTR